MKNFLKYILVLGTSVIIVMTGLDYLFTRIYRTGVPRNKLQNELKLANQHYDIGFYGSSRVESHIDCELITKITGKSCINLGFSGANLADILVLAELNKFNSVSIDTVLVQLDYNYNSERLSPYFKANIVPYMNKHIIDKALKGEEEYYFYKWIPFYKYLRNEKVLGLRGLFSVLLKRENNKNIEIKFKPQYGSDMAVAGSFPNILKEKNKMLTELQELYANKSLYFFTAPYCKNLNNRQKIELLRKKVKMYKNYYDIYDNKPEYFFNCGHLNEKGAEAFTLRIIKDYNF